MNRNTHLVAGVLAAGVAYACDCFKHDKSFDAGELFVYGVGGAIGSALPDQIEPAYSPYHRDTAHSVAALGANVLALYQIDELVPDLHPSVRVLAKGLTIGYVSHLALDACTPMGLPLIGNGGHR